MNAFAKHRLSLVVVSVVLGIALATGGRALAAGTCSRPTSFLARWVGLTWFCPDEPALAAEMNANFATVVGWLEQKVGPVGTPTLTLSGAPVTSASIADGTIDAVDLAPGLVSTRELADGGVTAAKLASRVTVYSVNGACPSPGTLTTQATCTEALTAVSCVIPGSPCAFSQRYTQCDGSCGSCVPVFLPQACVRPNSFVGFLVGP